MRTHVVELSGGVSVSVDEAGDGAVLMLLHAGVSERHMWDRQWEWLQHSMRVVRWDWRGFGDTPHVPGPFSYMDDLLRIMDAMQIERATLMGCSFAGGVAIETAILHPDRVERLVLVASGLPGYEFPMPREIEALFEEADAAFSEEKYDRARQLMEQIWLIGPGRRPEDVDGAYLEKARTLLQRADQPDNGAVSTEADWVKFESLSWWSSGTRTSRRSCPGPLCWLTNCRRSDWKPSKIRPICPIWSAPGSLTPF